MKIALPTAAGKLEPYKLTGEPIVARKPKAPFNRIAFAAAHVVANPLSNADPSGAPDIDSGEATGLRRAT